MKFNCGPTAAERYDAAQAELALLSEWHPWFAWAPVRVSSGDCRWLEWIERKANTYRQHGQLIQCVYHDPWKYRARTWEAA